MKFPECISEAAQGTAIVSGEEMKIWKEAIVASFKVLSRHSNAETEENREAARTGQPGYEQAASLIQVRSLRPNCPDVKL
jgi:hypothetical protein